MFLKFFIVLNFISLINGASVNGPGKVIEVKHEGRIDLCFTFSLSNGEEFNGLIVGYYNDQNLFNSLTTQSYGDPMQISSVVPTRYKNRVEIKYFDPNKNCTHFEITPVLYYEDNLIELGATLVYYSKKLNEINMIYSDRTKIKVFVDPVVLKFDSIVLKLEKKFENISCFAVGSPCPKIEIIVEDTAIGKEDTLNDKISLELVEDYFVNDRNIVDKRLYSCVMLGTYSIGIEKQLNGKNAVCKANLEEKGLLNKKITPINVWYTYNKLEIVSVSYKNNSMSSEITIFWEKPLVSGNPENISYYNVVIYSLKLSFDNKTAFEMFHDAEDINKAFILNCTQENDIASRCLNMILDINTTNLYYSPTGLQPLYLYIAKVAIMNPAGLSIYTYSDIFSTEFSKPPSYLKITVIAISLCLTTTVILIILGTIICIRYALNRKKNNCGYYEIPRDEDLKENVIVNTNYDKLFPLCYSYGGEVKNPTRAEISKYQIYHSDGNYNNSFV